MTRVNGYRQRMFGPKLDRNEDFEVHLELQHGWEDKETFDRQLELAERVAEIVGKPAIEVAHEMEHAEGYLVPNWPALDDAKAWEATPETGSTPHHHLWEQNVVVYDYELDIDDDMIQDQP